MMKGKYRLIMLASSVFLLAVAAAGYWYVFIAGAPQLDAPKQEKHTGLNFQVETFTSDVMDDVREYGVVLPPGYQQHPERHYPVIVLLHGGHGTARDYEDKAALTSVLHDLYQAKRLLPVIVVTPDGNDKRGSSPLWDPNYYDGPNGKVGTLIGSEFVKVVQSRYRTLTGPKFWAIGGLSSGGWGALNIGLHHVKQFHTFFSHTGYFIDHSGPDNSPQLLVQKLPIDLRKQLHIYLDAGENDERYLDATEQFHQTLDELDIPNEFHVFPGGHGIVGQNVGWNYWHQHLYDSLSFVGKRFARVLKSSKPATHTKAKPKPHAQPVPKETGNVPEAPVH